MCGNTMSAVRRRDGSADGHSRDNVSHERAEAGAPPLHTGLGERPDKCPGTPQCDACFGSMASCSLGAEFGDMNWEPAAQQAGRVFSTHAPLPVTECAYCAILRTVRLEQFCDVLPVIQSITYLPVRYAHPDGSGLRRLRHPGGRASGRR